MLKKLMLFQGMIIFIINFLIDIIFYISNKINLNKEYYNEDYIAKIKTFNEFGLVLGIISLNYSLLLIVILEHLFNFTINARIMSHFIYFIFINYFLEFSSNSFTLTEEQELIFEKENNFLSNELNKLKYNYSIIFGLSIILIILLLFKCVVLIYNLLKDALIFYFMNGGSIFTFELINLLN